MVVKLGEKEMKENNFEERSGKWGKFLNGIRGGAVKTKFEVVI